MERDEDWKPSLLVPGNPDERKLLPDELAHYGVKGMKWGVHNEETKYRYGELTRPSVKDLFDNVQDRMVTKQSEKNKMFRDMHPDAFPMKKTQTTSEQDQAKVNPFYHLGRIEAQAIGLQYGYNANELYKAYNKAFYEEGITNCASCSVVYDLRKRGYDVDANMTENLAFIRDDLDEFYPGAKTVNVPSIGEVNRQLSEMPVGARGYLGGVTIYGSGHAVAWEMTEDGLVYRDCQSDKTYTPETINQVYDDREFEDEEYYPHYARLDELQPDLEYIYNKGIVSKTGLENDADLRKDRIREVNVDAFRNIAKECFDYDPTDISEAMKWGISGMMAVMRAAQKGHSPHVNTDNNLFRNMSDLRNGIVKDSVRDWYLKKQLLHSIEAVEALQDEHYGLPGKKKYPMPDRDHVLSAIRFFNYADPSEEKELAGNILKRMDELGITGIKVGEVNRFKQYYDKSRLAHHGVKGMKWGVWNEETAARYNGKDRIFVSGSSKTQTKDSGYYRKKLPFEVRQDIKQGIKAGSTFLVGDAPGIDRQVQDYLKQKKYDKVEIYGPGKEVRYQADKSWKTKSIDAPQYEKGSKEWLREKDIAMTNDSTKGLAVILDDGANATRNNVKRLKGQNKNVKVYALDNGGERYDSWIYSDDVLKDEVKKRLISIRGFDD